MFKGGADCLDENIAKQTCHSAACLFLKGANVGEIEKMDFVFGYI